MVGALNGWKLGTVHIIDHPQATLNSNCSFRKAAAAFQRSYTKKNPDLKVLRVSQLVFTLVKLPIRF